MKTFDVGKLNARRPRYTKDGGFNVKVNYDGNPIQVTTSVVDLPYGVDQTKKGKCSIKVIVDDPVMIEKLKDINQWVMNLPDQQNWFNDDDQLFFHTPFLESNNSLRIKLPIVRGVCKFDVLHFDDQGEQLVTMEDLIPGCKLIVTMEWKNIWILSNKVFGYFWVAKTVEIL